jgi:Rab-like protein 2
MSRRGAKIILSKSKLEKYFEIDHLVTHRLNGMEGNEQFNDPDLKVILLGDSAVGKSKLVERYMEDEYNPRRSSTQALTLYRKNVTLGDGSIVKVDLWDTAGQDTFSSIHSSYYYQTDVCILIFDVTRKQTYTNLSKWYEEFRQHCKTAPCIVVANKIDVDHMVTRKAFKFPLKHNLPFFFVSSADGTNVVKVRVLYLCH